MKKFNKHIELSKEIEDAIKNNKPIVALESTIISHGMPYPKNVETALNVEKIIRENNAVPATIAIIKGKLKVGLTKEEINYFGKKGSGVTKASRRDIPLLISRKGDGATTVAATMIIANLVGIKVFATGGIGGVHRGAETTMDISADLEELAQTPIIVVCSGAKSILDLGLTMEYLETKGVAVLGYKTDMLPAFYTPKSGFKVDYRMETPGEIAIAYKAQEDILFRSAMLVTNPIPEKYAIDYDYITNAIERSVSQASDLGIKGKETTPFLLDKIQKITMGTSLEANINLTYNNALLAAKIAYEVNRM